MSSEYIKDWRLWVSLSVLAIIFTAAYVPFASLGYAGGGEVTASFSYLSVDDSERYPYGQHYVDDWDIDGDFGDYTWNVTTGNAYLDALFGNKPNTVSIDSVKKCGVTVESGNPYHLQKIGNQYVQVEDGVIAKTYEKTFGDTVYKYNLMYFGMSVTMKTAADVFYVDPVIFSHFSVYGYHFENQKIDVDLRQTFAIATWHPVGVYNESYTITGGWAGIMDTEIYEVSYGLIQEGATENYNHVIENLQSVGSTPNMYHLKSDNPVAVTEFTDDSALTHIPQAVDIELGARMQAGAQYHVDGLGKWDSCAVRNVYVTYNVVVKVVATLEMSFITEGNELEDPDEENTFYKPQVGFYSDFEAAWNEFAADMAEYFNSPAGLLMIFVVIVGGGVVIYVIIRIRSGGLV